MEPFILGVQLATPVALGMRSMPLTLDGILTYLVAKKEGYNAGLPLWYDLDNVKKIRENLPLARLEKNGVWVYRASLPRIVGKVLFWYTGFTRKDDWLLANRTPKIRSLFPPGVRTDQGSLKSYCEAIQYILTDRLLFYGVGDIGKIVEIVRTTCKPRGFAVGKLRRIGFGLVRRVWVTETDSDYSILDENGRPSRFIPVELLEMNEPVVRMATLPPYWFSGSERLCYAPDAKRWLWRQFDKEGEN